jgi:pilus assembly protein CpaC
VNTQNCRRKVVFLGIVTLLASFAGRSSPAQQIVSGARQVMTVSMGESTLLKYPGALQRFSIGDPQIADAVAVSPSELLITGKKLGTTTLLVWDPIGQVRIYSVEVTADAPALQRYLKGLFPDAQIAVVASGNWSLSDGCRVPASATSHRNRQRNRRDGDQQTPGATGSAGAAQVRFAEVSRTAAKEMSTWRP